jgi:hypothetical protein
MADGRTSLRKAHDEIAELRAEVEALKAAQGAHLGYGHGCHSCHCHHGCWHPTVTWYPTGGAAGYNPVYTVSTTNTAGAVGGSYTITS